MPTPQQLAAALTLSPSGQTPIRPDITTQSLFSRANRQTPIRTPTEGIGRLAATAVAQSRQRKAQERARALIDQRRETQAQGLSAAIAALLPKDEQGNLSPEAQQLVNLAADPHTTQMALVFGGPLLQQQFAPTTNTTEIVKGSEIGISGDGANDTFEVKKDASGKVVSRKVLSQSSDLLSADAEAQQARLKSAGRSETNVETNVDTTGNAFSKEFGKRNAQQFFERRAAAQEAAKGLPGIAEARELVESGIISGTAADFRVGLGKALQTIGFNEGDTDIARTEAFVAVQAQQVAKIIQQFGAGTGLSDADREFAIKAAGGDISMTELAIRRILDINERASRRILDTFNKDAGQIDPSLSPFPLAVEVPEVVPRRKKTGDGDDGVDVTKLSDEELAEKLGGVLERLQLNGRNR